MHTDEYRRVLQSLLTPLMMNRRKFLTLVRNRVAAGVLCSGLLSDALVNSVPAERAFTATEALARLNQADKKFGGVVVRGTFNHLLSESLKKDFTDAYKDFENFESSHIMFIEPGDISNSVIEITEIEYAPTTRS